MRTVWLFLLLSVLAVADPVCEDIYELVVIGRVRWFESESESVRDPHKFYVKYYRRVDPAAWENRVMAPWKARLAEVAAISISDGNPSPKELEAAWQGSVDESKAAFKEEIDRLVDLESPVIAATREKELRKWWTGREEHRYVDEKNRAYRSLVEESARHPPIERERRVQEYYEQSILNDPKLKALAARKLLKDLRSSYDFMSLFDQRDSDTRLHAVKLLREAPEEIVSWLDDDRYRILAPIVRHLAPDFETVLKDPQISRPMNVAAAPARRVETPVPSLYESIPVGEVRLGDLKLGNGSISGPKGSHGNVNRWVDKSGTLIFSGAWIDPAHNFVNVPGVTPLVPGRGVPTQTFLTLQAMKQAKIPYGGLKRAKTNTIGNYQAAVELALSEPVRKYAAAHPGQPIPDSVVTEAIRETHTFRYIETALIQSGHRVKDVRAVGSQTQSLWKFIDEKALLSPHLQHLFRKSGPLKPSSPAPLYFTLEFELEPFTP